MREKQKEIEDRTKNVAIYVIEHGTTVRATAIAFEVSKSTIHKDLTERLQKISQHLYLESQKVLKRNKDERAKRGGEATRCKYLRINNDVKRGKQ